ARAQPWSLAAIPRWSRPTRSGYIPWLLHKNRLPEDERRTTRLRRPRHGQPQPRDDRLRGHRLDAGAARCLVPRGVRRDRQRTAALHHDELRLVPAIDGVRVDVAADRAG